MLQNQVFAMQSIGKPGVISRAHLNFKNVIGAVVIDDNVVAGSFVQLGDEHNDNTTTQVKGATGQPVNNPILGVALFEYTSLCDDVNGAIQFKRGDTINVLTTGNVFVLFEQTCSVGQYLMIKEDDGTLMASSTGNDGGYVNTGWKILKTATTAGNNIIEITKSL